jgi:hypothetical protein
MIELPKGETPFKSLSWRSRFISKQDFLHLHCEIFGLKMSANFRPFLYMRKKIQLNKKRTHAMLKKTKEPSRVKVVRRRFL